MVRGSPNLAHRAILLAGIAIATIVAIVGWRIYRSYVDRFEAAAHNQQHAAQLFEANADATFQSAEIVLDQAIDEINARRASSTGPSLGQRFLHIGAPWGFIYGIGFIEKDGILRQVERRDNGVPGAAVAEIDRSRDEMFTAHRDGLVAANAVFIRTPYRTLLQKEAIIAVTKAVRDPDGAFAGVAVVTVNIDTFARMFATLEPAPFLGVALYRTDGQVLFATPSDSRAGSAAVRNSLLDRLRTGEPNGVYMETDPISGARRQLALAASQRYPVAIFFGADVEKILEPWRRGSIAFVGAAAIAILIICALTYWLLLHIAAEEKAQQTVRENERRLRESQRIAGVGHFERDIAANRTYWADNMYELHGITPEQFPDGREALKALIHPDDRAELLESLRMQWAGGVKSGMVERRIVRPDGNERIIRYEWRRNDGPAHGAERVFGVAQDITAIRATEAALRDNEQRLRDLLECSSDFIWETNAEGVVTLFAGADVDRFDALGRHGAATHEREGIGDDNDVKFFEQATRRREPFRNLVIAMRARNGELRWIRASGKPQFDAEGVFLGYRGAGADITETRRLRLLNEENRKAEALGRLASGMAHEINNLLQPIMIYAAFGNADEETGPAQKRYFSRIGRAAEAAVQIVRNVLSFARQRPPNCEDIALGDSLRDILDLLGDTLPAGITRVVPAVDADCVIRVDRSGFAQVLTNLITNAVEAMPNGGTIEIRSCLAHVGPEEAHSLGIRPGTHCVLSVADTGAGIPPEQIDKVFDPFFTTKPQGKGTGLGLSVVAGHVKSWGGATTVASASGEGTVFSLYLPIAQPQMMAAQ